MVAVSGYVFVESFLRCPQPVSLLLESVGIGA